MALYISQWYSTTDCIQRFKNDNKNKRYSFVKYDTKEFYCSVTEMKTTKCK